MLNLAISVTFKLIILIMLLYILAYIVDMIYFDVYLYPKILKAEMEKEKLLDESMGKVVNDIFEKIKELEDDE